MNNVLEWFSLHAVEIIGVIFGALFTAIFQNLDAIKNIIKPGSAKFLNGEWVSASREYNSVTGKYENGNDTLVLREKSSNDGKIQITGLISTATGGLARKWNARGIYYKGGSVLIIRSYPKTALTSKTAHAKCKTD